MSVNVVKEIVKGVGLDYEYYEDFRSEDFDFDWVMVVLIKSKEDIEKYKELIEKMHEIPDELRGGFITFKVVGGGD